MFAAIDHALRPGGLVVFGELHGTHEAPRFLAAAAALAAARGPIVVAIEVPFDFQPRVDSFLATGDRAALLAPHGFWTFQDGRAGAALVELRGAPPSARPRPLLRQSRRDRRTSRRRDGPRDRRRLSRRRDAGLVRQPACGLDPAVDDVASARSRPRPRRARHRVSRGAAFISIDGTGVTPCGSRTGDPRRGVELHAARDEHGFDGVYRVGPLTPSLPVHLASTQ